MNGTERLAFAPRVCLESALVGTVLVLLAFLPAEGQESLAIRTPIDGPSTLATDSHAHLFVIEMMENKVLRINLQDGTISTVAGNGEKCCYKDGAEATQVSLDFLRSLAVDPRDNIYIGNDDQIEEVESHTGRISIFAGDAKSGNTVDGEGARSAHFWGIDGLAFDSNGVLFIADEFQSRIFDLDPGIDIVHRYAGANSGFGGDGGPAVDASFRFPGSIATDKDGNLIIADFENCRIRRVDRSTGVIQTIAVTGGVAEGCLGGAENAKPGPYPSDPVVDSHGNIYFLEGAMDRVFRINAKTLAVTVVAGNGHRGFSGDGGPATEAELGNPSGLAVDAVGNIFVSEFVNNRIRRVDAKTGIITTIAGNGLPHRVDIQL